MTEEIKYYKEKEYPLKWIPAEEMEETPQQTIARLERENKELKEEIQFHNKENSNLLAERNAAQIGYDEMREARERYRSALEEIREIADKCKECLNEDDDCGCDYLRIKRRIDEVLGNENN